MINILLILKNHHYFSAVNDESDNNRHQYDGNWTNALELVRTNRADTIAHFYERMPTMNDDYRFAYSIVQVRSRRMCYRCMFMLIDQSNIYCQETKGRLSFDAIQRISTVSNATMATDVSDIHRRMRLSNVYRSTRMSSHSTQTLASIDDSLAAISIDHRSEGREISSSIRHDQR